ncbi:hypothetical protein MRB53_035861 [Persea americana]|uniref:Uncharacterized protein n=1 Tax=Persea americana TaxID=3435 RepID=A0ACC2K5V1_PERAE|nr:hypothetical protein MRB53_035861 [Persea americana]
MAIMKPGKFDNQVKRNTTKHLQTRPLLHKVAGHVRAVAAGFKCKHGKATILKHDQQGDGRGSKVDLDMEAVTQAEGSCNLQLRLPLQGRKEKILFEGALGRPWQMAPLGSNPAPSINKQKLIHQVTSTKS